MEAGSKRKATDAGGGNGDKRAKTKKQWRPPKTSHQQNGSSAQNHTAKDIHSGDSGIWVTCGKGREGKCVMEMRDLFNEYAKEMYPQSADGPDGGEGDAEGEMDIEREIQAELDEMKKPARGQLFTHVRVNLQCVVFFKTIAPVVPTDLVKRICEDAMNNSAIKRTRFAQRLTPMTLMGRASAEGLEKVCLEVLAPHFHQEPFQRRKFAIRPTLRNHNLLSRNDVIKQVAPLVGRGHEVDLKNYDLLILVELYQHVCGVCVVDTDYERLKRYNISEIYEPTPPQEPNVAATAKAEKCAQDETTDEVVVKATDEDSEQADVEAKGEAVVEAMEDVATEV
ncbi:unnamed protein product [Zymoseptoria tritici ST99CH_3D1]|nr:unnamed protein product [Zymoseptoria tritici ST99CH_3D1]